MRNLILTFLIMATPIKAFIFPNFFQHSVNKVNLDMIPEKTNVLTKIGQFNHELINNGIQHFKTEYSPEIVKFSSGVLPAMDSIAHHVLKANQNFITFVLNLDNIPEHVKKDLVVFSISSAQHGDSVGGQILEFYYHLVDKLL